ncbi:MAG TPA: penicillin-binding transpeptidase domain-containing protein, partial [bacterium]|nr:penicillin-binding transpeptidase domain-containing protein [bacterium]
AQKFDTRLKAYAENQYISSFIGFTPLEDPRLAIFIAYDTPRKNGYYGGLVAGPVFKALAEETLKYMGEVSREQANTTTKIAQNKTDAKTNLAIVTPEQKWTSAQKDLSQNKVPNLKGLSLRQVLTLTQGTPVQLTVKGSGIVVKQMPESGDLTNTKEFVLTLGERT